ncbi:MAG: hypothetical protein ACPL7D_05980 [Candidatus Sumerlaeaceae bacterium]
MRRKRWLILVLLCLLAVIVWWRKEILWQTGVLPPPEQVERRVTLTFSGNLGDLAKDLERQTGLHYEVADELREQSVKFECRDAPVFRVHMLLSKQANVSLVRDAIGNTIHIVAKR